MEITYYYYCIGGENDILFSVVTARDVMRIRVRTHAERVLTVVVVVGAMEETGGKKRLKEKQIKEDFFFFPFFLHATRGK